MYVTSSPAAARRSPETSRRRGDCSQPTRAAAAERPQRDTTAARRTRLDDAIVSQWLLDQLRAPAAA